MTRTRARRPRNAALRLPLVLGALALGALSSCDNPACVFGPSVCQNLPGGGANAVAATFPDTGELVVPGGPVIEAVFPSGFAHPESPVVLVFSESISPSTIQDAFSITSTGGIGGGPGGSASAALIGDGRVLILIPSGLAPGLEYEIAYTENASVRDLSGALALQPADGVVGSFTVDDDPSEAPEVLMTWPFDGATGVSTITEVVTVFNRIMDPLTFSGLSWDVTVDGLDPAFDPLPEPIEVAASTPGGGDTSDSRVWRWRSVDPVTDARANLGEDLPLAIALSTGIQQLTTLAAPGEMGVPLDATTITATTAGFSAPATIDIVSAPSDAIGIENLNENGIEDLMLDVGIVPVPLDGDVLEIFIVGSNPDEDPEAPNLISLQRELVLDSMFIGEVNAADLALTSSSTPLVTLLADGDVSMAFAVRRGDQRSALRVLDVDVTTEGIQDALLDTSPPTFLNVLGLEEGETVYRSDLRELALAGFASEEPRTVELIAMLSGGAVDNRVAGQLPPLPAFNLGGAFVAAPIDLGIVPRSEFPLDVSVIVYDRALNAAPPVTLQYTQRAGSGEGQVLPGSGLDVEVTVYDATTLEPIVGARVYANEAIGDIVQPWQTPTSDTDANGFATIASAPFGSTILTVEAAGYDLFTFQGVPTTRLDVPLTPATLPFGAATVIVSAEGEALSSPFIENRVADSRVTLPGETTRLADACVYNLLTNQTTCSFLPPLTIRALEAGLITLLSTKAPNDLSDPGAFSAGTYLQAFELNYPRPPVEAAAVDNILVQVGELLSGAGVPPSEAPLATAPQVFVKPPNYSLDFMNPAGGPRVSVEAFANGIRGSMTVGLGVPYFNGFTDAWDIRAAYSARAGAGGELASQLAIEDERYLRVEIVDASTNRTGVRQPLSTATGGLTPPGVPNLSSPSQMMGPAGPDYDLVYEDVLDGTQNGEGLYRALLVDSTGRRWHLWTLDLPTSMGPTVTTHVPPIAIQGGVPLASGLVTCFIDAWSWEGFDPGSFLFSDIQRRHDRFTSASGKTFSQP